MAVFRAMSQCRPIDSSDDELFDNAVPRKCSTSRKSLAFKRVRLQSDSEEEAINLSVRTVAQSSTVTPSGLDYQETAIPKGNQLIDSFNANLDEILVKHRACLKEIRRKEKASNIEFLSSVRYLILGEVLTVDNSSLFPEVIVNGLNLMTLQAGPEPSKFGRELAKKVFGEGEDCVLIGQMIGQGRKVSDVQIRVELHLEKAFEGLTRFHSFSSFKC